MYLFGASGHCKVIIDIILKSNIEVIEYIIDDNPTKGEINTIPILKTPNHDYFIDKSLIISIGNNEIRKKIANRFLSNYLIAIHPKSTLGINVSVNEGTVIMAGAIINSDVIIGKHCIINTNAVVEHDCYLENFVHISPSASLAGNVFVGEGTHVGIGAVIIQGVKIGKWVTIGAGAVILHDVPDFAVIVGNPGKIIKYNSIVNE
jgi:sugar O-acyltransferase (sialic acid O-acetyltransferase NeuD family)